MSSLSAEDVYESLVEIFRSRKSTECFEIEILLPGQGPLLRDGTFIGITKMALTKAFVIARKRFMQCLEDAMEGHSASVEEHTECAAATEIILLFDCEHTTVCNWRKRRVAASINRYITEDTRRQALQDFFESELNLISTFVCSPLHRHTKSPTLWQHRLWLMTERMRLQGRLQENIFLSPEAMHKFILAEWEVVCRAGELHPKNYYAFSYMRRLHLCVSKLSERAGDTAVIQDSALLHELAVTLVEPTLKWCLSNPKDVSGWMFLVYLLSHEDLPGKQDMRQLRKVAIERTLHFAVEIAAWDGESLWTFVDLMVTRFGPTILPGNFDQKSTNLKTTNPTGKSFNEEDINSKERSARWKTTMQHTTAGYSRSKENI
ncbi:uncharacterized protein TRUGW13939_03449 [Talaromyces rugulosus]|uniref:Uncharacterized protein n=1 Tax=Talaromyces rugulosus TaxID=121627 RepID=A0A7H8QR31_TALRU|nr:uncharacterized protein TRUGW13939_03449 [Talaromyces rugulosus]QKX56348.1 hypothetical protein TRUGW13939_03449 [Talaromyces rugulosus]